MATSAISSVSGGYTRLLRANSEAERTAAPVEANAAPDSTALTKAEAASGPADEAASPDTLRSQAILDEGELTERSKSLDRARELGGRSIEVLLEISNLRTRDAEVRRHEAAHIAAGDGYIIGGAAYAYQTGPDGIHYAVGGEVGIDTAAIPGKPEETARKMRMVKAAALAPSQPSAADFAVAAAAAQAEATAMAEIAAARSQELAARYAGEMSAARQGAGAPAALPPASAGSRSSLRDDGPPPTPFDVIA